jgi:hypothetical protein
MYGRNIAIDSEIQHMVCISPSLEGRFKTARNEPLSFIKAIEFLEPRKEKTINMLMVRNLMIISDNYSVTGIHISGKRTETGDISVEATANSI